MSGTAAETAQTLLAAMDAEEPFQLLKTLPGKMEELWAIQRQTASSEVRDTTPHVLSPLILHLETPSGGNITEPIENL